MSDAAAPRTLDCPVGRAIGVLQEKWVLHIVHALLDGPRGFNDLGRAVGGCNPTTLTQRLARLEDVGLVVRSTENENGGRSSYALTASGEALSDVIDAIHAWSLQHLHSAGPVDKVRHPTRTRVRESDRRERSDRRDSGQAADGDPLSAS